MKYLALAIGIWICAPPVPRDAPSKPAAERKSGPFTKGSRILNGKSQLGEAGRDLQTAPKLRTL